MKRRGLIATIVSAAVLALGTGVASAVTYSTTIVIDGVGGTVDHTQLIGHLESSKSKCLAGRLVKVFAHYSDGSLKLVGTDHSSTNGEWFDTADFTGANGAKVVVTRKDISTRHHHRVCGSDSQIIVA